MKRIPVIGFLLLISTLVSVSSEAESRRHYENRFKAMFDYSVRINEYVRRRLEDRGLCAYAQAMAEVNAARAEQMTPPKKYTTVHHHFLLVLENVERSFYYAAEGKLSRYRHHQKIVRKELHMVETLAQREGLELYFYRD